jgi:CHAD domain-containing protein
MTTHELGASLLGVGVTRLSTVALAVFDQAQSALRLPDRMRRLLQLAADALSDARARSAENPAGAARDALLAASLADLDPEDRALAACAAAFQREKLRSQREVAFLRLNDRDRERAIRLAATLQLADAIAQSPAVQLAAQTDQDATILTIEGPGCSQLADKIRVRGELWREAIGKLTIVGSDADVPLTNAEPEARLSVPAARDALSGDELAGEGARRVLRRFFERMLAREEAIRKAEDPEDVHQMRVATRRLRASLQVAEAIYDPLLIQQFRKSLRRAAQALAIVRELDVFLLAIRKRQAELAEAEAGTLDQLITAVETERTAARVRMLADLQSRRYLRFKHDFAVFLTTPANGLAPFPPTGMPTRVRDVAGSAIWQRYEQWRAFEVVLNDGTDEVLHDARIAGKRLRYTFEFFGPALGPKLSELLDQLAELQEHLGLLQDGVTARTHIAALDLLSDPGAQAYLAYLETARATLLADLPRLWDKVASGTYRRRLFEMIARM